MWELDEKALKQALDDKQIDYVVNAGDGAFYGPKIDFHIRDVLKRSWQCGTIQLDFSMPERFGLTYIGSDGQKHTPVIQGLYGSIERFLGIIIENYAGAFPYGLLPYRSRSFQSAKFRLRTERDRSPSRSRAQGRYQPER